ncbi:MAG: type II secretion system protein [Kiritimatiellae bacterium]|nr:type II secretion system protein [Kiritimatiellia bacterium]MBP5227141.1 type II secretion system protein [Kiritimatiellia bacterium]
MKQTKKGFTIIELLVVISIIAIVATLATGAAIKSIRQGRERRIDAMIESLQMGLATYKVQEGEWPFTIGTELTRESTAGSTVYWCHGKQNRRIFTKLYESKGSGGGAYLDGSGLFCVYGGSRMKLNDVPRGSRVNLPIGYPRANDQTKFDFFCISYNTQTDAVTVHRQTSHNCPNQANKD